MNLEIISHTPESLLLLPQNRQEILIKLATLISALESDKPFRNKQSLMNIMSQCGLHLDSEVFEKLGPQILDFYLLWVILFIEQITRTMIWPQMTGLSYFTVMS